MARDAQRRAVRNYRARLGRRGIRRFEVLAPESDRELIRALARRLAGEGPDADEARAAVRKLVGGGPAEPAEPGGILRALRRSPLVGADLELERPREEGRAIDL